MTGDTFASLQGFTTISKLRIKYKLLDHTRDRITNFSEPPKVTSQCVAPDLGYTSNTSKHSLINSDFRSSLLCNRNIVY